MYTFKHAIPLPEPTCLVFRDLAVYRCFSFSAYEIRKRALKVINDGKCENIEENHPKGREAGKMEKS